MCVEIIFRILTIICPATFGKMQSVSNHCLRLVHQISNLENSGSMRQEYLGDTLGETSGLFVEIECKLSSNIAPGRKQHLAI